MTPPGPLTGAGRLSNITDLTACAGCGVNDVHHLYIGAPSRCSTVVVLVVDVVGVVVVVVAVV